MNVIIEIIIVKLLLLGCSSLATARKSSDLQLLRAYELPENIPACSIKRSRIAREVIINEIEAAMEKITSSSKLSEELNEPQYKIAMTPNCIFNLSKSIYHKLETGTKEYAQRFWRDRISGKLFRNEDYLDLYLYKKYFAKVNSMKKNSSLAYESQQQVVPENLLYNPRKHTVCLSRYCDNLLNGCYDSKDVDVNSRNAIPHEHSNHHKLKSLYLKKNKVSCTKKSIQIRHQQCLKIFHTCFATVPIGNTGNNLKQKTRQQKLLIKLLRYFDKTFCEYDICSNGPRNMIEDIGRYGAHSSLNNYRSYYVFFFNTYAGNFLLLLFASVMFLILYFYYSEKAATKLHDDLRKVRKNWSMSGKND